MGLRLQYLNNIYLLSNLNYDEGQFMTISNLILARVRLRSEVNVIPDKGLTVSRIRVELAEKKKSGAAWIAELNIIGDLPWLKGEERQVEMRIMSEEFRDYVISQSPSLLVKYGNEILGNLKLEK